MTTLNDFNDLLYGGGTDQRTSEQKIRSPGPYWCRDAPNGTWYMHEWTGSSWVMFGIGYECLEDPAVVGPLIEPPKS